MAINAKWIHFLKGSLTKLMDCSTLNITEVLSFPNLNIPRIFPLNCSTAFTRNIAYVSEYNFFRCPPLVSLCVQQCTTVAIHASDRAKQTIYLVHFYIPFNSCSRRVTPKNSCSTAQLTLFFKLSNISSVTSCPLTCSWDAGLFPSIPVHINSSFSSSYIFTQWRILTRAPPSHF